MTTAFSFRPSLQQFIDRLVPSVSQANGDLWLRAYPGWMCRFLVPVR